MTDSELQGIAMQAINLAKRDYEAGILTFVLAAYHQSEGLHRMKKIEGLINERAGKNWLNNEAAKNAVFGMLRMANVVSPPDAIAFACAGNAFHPTEKMLQLSESEQNAILNSSHQRHHLAVTEGLLSIRDVLHCVTQTPQRVCVCIQPVNSQHEYTASVKAAFYDQGKFHGRLKLF